MNIYCTSITRSFSVKSHSCSLGSVANFTNHETLAEIIPVVTSCCTPTKPDMKCSVKWVPVRKKEKKKEKMYKLQLLVQRGEPGRERLLKDYYSQYTPDSARPLQEFCDQYFDTPDFQLASQNIWLRFRDGDWTLKQANRLDIDDYSEICQALSKILQVAPQKEPLDYCCTPIAIFRTFRDPRIHLDVTAFTSKQYYISGCCQDVFPARVAWCLLYNPELVHKLDLPAVPVPLVDKPSWIPE